LILESFDQKTFLPIPARRQLMKGLEWSLATFETLVKISTEDVVKRC
jgi:hypothetical protein